MFLRAGAVSGVSGLLAVLSAHVSTVYPQSTRTLYYNVRLYCHRLYARLLGRVHYSRFVQHCRHPDGGQAELLSAIITANSASEYGQRHGFGDVGSAEDYRRMAPLMEHFQYEDLLRRTQQGEMGLLTSGHVVRMGTTECKGRTHMWPVVDDPRALKARTTTAFLWVHFLFCKVWITLRPVLRLSYEPCPPTELSDPVRGLPTVPLLRYTNPVTSDYFVTPREAYTLRDETTAYYVHAVFALSCGDLEGIEFGRPAQCSHFWQLVHSHWPHMCSQIQHGELSTQLDLSPRMRTVLNARLEASPGRAQQLRGEFARGWEGVAPRIWPHCCFVDLSNCTDEREEAALLLGCELAGTPHVSVVHAHGGVTLGVHINTTQAYVFLPHANFYEFICEEAWHQEQPATLLLHQVRQALSIYTHE